MPQLVTIPIAIFEIVIEYARPNMKLLVDRAIVVDRLFEAFRPWNVRIDDVEAITKESRPNRVSNSKYPQKGPRSCSGPDLAN